MRRELLKRAALDLVATLTARHPVLLPRTASHNSHTLEVVAPYRVENDRLRLNVGHREAGVLNVTMLGYEGFVLSRELWRLAPIQYTGPTTIEFDLDRRTIEVGGVARRGTAPPLSVPRRFCFDLELKTAAGT